MASDGENKLTGQVTLLIYRIAIGPVLLALAGGVWQSQREIDRLTQENDALFATNAKLEKWAVEVSRQAAYMDGLKDTVLAGVTGPREVRLNFQLPTEALEATLADIEADQEAAVQQQETTFQAWLEQIKRAWGGGEKAEEGSDSTAAAAKPTAREHPQQRQEQQQQVQQQQQQQIPDYDRMPSIDEKALDRYRQTKTKGASN